MAQRLSDSHNSGPNYTHLDTNDNTLPSGDHELGIDTPRASGYGLQPPRASYLMADNDSSTGLTPRGSFLNQTPNDSSAALAAGTSSPVPKEEIEHHDGPSGNDYEAIPRGGGGKQPPSKLKRLIGLAALALVLLAVVIGLSVGLTVKKHGKNNSAVASGSSTGSPTQTAGPAKPTGASRITGGDGSVITQDDGTKFTYKNSFGGFWVSDPNDPFNNNAQPNSWTPPLNTSWNWSKDKINGVNLGGLFVLEPFITPPLYQKYPGAVDEWTLSTLMAADTANGGLNQLEEHYKTFITEQDIAEIAGAGLNWVRVPIPYWAVDVFPGEPFLARTSWKYIVRLLGWCRKYGLRVNLDLHTAPGSQNGFNHSGRGGQINFLHGPMGIANAQRLLNYIRIITEFISQPEYQNLVVMFGIINEASTSDIGMEVITSFYQEAHDMIRSITGKGEGKGPFISIHDGFHNDAWSGFLEGSDRIALDTHPYLAFSGGATTEPINVGTGINAGGSWPGRACGWSSLITGSQQTFGVSIAGEFSNGFNDCGLFLLGVTQPPQTADCAKWQDASTWDDATKAGVMNFAMASMDALQQWFFWTWKVGNATNGVVSSPLWSYKAGLEGGWIPKDPRTAVGFCSQIGQPVTPFAGQFQPWQTGGAGAGQILAQHPWPPATIAPGLNVGALPTYTSTGPINTLPPPTFSPEPKPKPTLNGWYNKDDTAGGPATIAGVTYPDAWDESGNNAVVPAAVVPAAVTTTTRAGAGGAVPAAAATTTTRGAAGGAAPAATATTAAGTADPDDAP